MAIPAAQALLIPACPASKAWRRVERAALVLLPIGFLLAALLRARPFVNDVTKANSGHDDWFIYFRYANDILGHGLAIPSLSVPYARPGGFAYNYLLAGVFGLFGANSSYVYVLQSLLLGISVSVMYLAVRRYLSVPVGAALLTGLTLFAVADVFRHYTFRLLSENFLLFLLPLFFLALLASQKSESAWRRLPAGLIMGLAVLARPNVVAVAAAVTVLLAVWRAPGWKRRLMDAGVFAGCWIALLCLLFLRDFAALGRVSLLTFTYTGDWPILPADAAGVIGLYVRRILYALGLLPVYAPDYRVRPHWLVAWLGLVVLTVMALVRRKSLGFAEALLYTFVGSYLGPLLAVAQITNYGFRMIAPALPTVLALDAILLTKLLDRDAIRLPRIGRRVARS